MVDMAIGISNEKYEDLELIKNEVVSVLNDLLEQSTYEEGDVLVVGCSSSEVAGKRLGTFSSEEIGAIVAKTLYEECRLRKINLAAQCCEHLNRALIIDKSVAKERGYETVCVVPKLKAGGSFATAVYKLLPNAVAVEHIKAELGIDIGDVMIGMHLKDVAVPVRTKIKSIGSAHVVCAKTRPKLIGGERAEYC
ncbi:MAG: TIGR01440 family protein [Lachnospiraceae bacterium]|nr:TIGR01440 family protein [Lachnospiraceae bacterium]MBQ9233839.1 TIGR01440 family protein [Lachnospiraceae bacterium]